MFLMFKDWVVVDEGGGGYGLWKKKKKEWIRLEPLIVTIRPKKYPKRSESANQFISEVKNKIMETGIVKNSRKPYDTKNNKRYKVSTHNAEVIAWKIAKSHGLRAGRKP